MNKYKKIVIFITCVLWAICMILGGCGSHDKENSSDQEQTWLQRNGQKIALYDIEKYKKGLIDERKSIEEVSQSYLEEVESVKNAEYKNFSFDACEFTEFPKFESLHVMMETDHGITTEESWNTIEEWLESIGKRDLVDMEKEVRIVASEIPWDESKEFPYSYPALYEHMDLSDGAGAFVTTKECHMQISYDGVYSMSDGKMNAYLKDDALAHGGALGDYSWNIVEEGNVSELFEKSYPLIFGELTIGEGAELVKQYFEAGTPFALEEGVELSVPEVSVFTLGDVYGYDYKVQRVYKGVPIAFTGYYTYFPGRTGIPGGDIKHAYVVDDEGVSAYAGNNASAVLTELYSDVEMIGFEQAVTLLSEKMAGRISSEIDKAGLVYAKVSFDEGLSHVLFPCWGFSGKNLTKNEAIDVYVDVFTGDIYYRTLVLYE